MNRITLENYRCFREKQDVPLAPLTLLVGDNSTGKTSFLAMIRALWHLLSDVPHFTDEPYDLGSFDDIAHYRGGRGGRADSFCAGIDFRAPGEPPTTWETRHLSVRFKDVGTVAFPVAARLSTDDDEVWIKATLDDEPRSWRLTLGTARGTWFLSDHFLPSTDLALPFTRWLSFFDPVTPFTDEVNGRLTSTTGAEHMIEDDWHRLRVLAIASYFLEHKPTDLYASAPVRSRPYRTYDPSNLLRDPEGDHVPLHLANMSWQPSGRQWTQMKKELETFGQQSGLFDEIRVKRLGKRRSEPFQLQIRKFGSHAKGPARNLIDVGYGVSQVLPLLIELFRDDGPTMLLLQQPEVHLHPSAQAALGSLFCQVASDDRQLVVETHSDHLLDRVRMDIRDHKTALEPKDVAILFFEKQNLGVRIHPVRINEDGNVVDAPSGYRRFFMTEMKRSLGL